MSVRFVLGRAGSGKTAHCLSAIRRRLADDPLHGPRLILLVPEQAGLQMERAIMAPVDPAEPDTHRAAAIGPAVVAAHRAEVLSFQRLAARVLEDTGGPSRVALTEPARAMVLRHVLAENADRLRYYRRVDRVGGFLDRLSATVMELIREDVSPAALTTEPASAATSPGRADPLPLFANPALPPPALEPHHAAKLHDLRVIYSGYLEYLAAGRIDPAQHLSAARALLPRCPWLHGAMLWVDGFASFTEQEMLTFLALARLCAQVDITVLIDPSLASGSVSATDGAATRLFARTQESLVRLRRRIRQAGLTELPPLSLDPPIMPRLARNDALQIVERNLFRPGRPQPEALPRQAVGVELIELPSRRIEVEYAVSLICDWVNQRKNPLRYRDIAVVVRDLEPYHELLGDALRSRNIPYFIDRRRPISHHPLVEFMRSAVRVAAEDLSLESMRLLLKTDLLPIERDTLDDVENHILARGIAGRKAWHQPWTARVVRRGHETKAGTQRLPDVDSDQRLNTARLAALEPMRQWLDFAAAPAGHSGRNWGGALVDLLRRCGADRALAEWSSRAETAGELDEAEVHEQTWVSVLSVLDDLGYALGDVVLPLDQLGDVLAAGLASLSLGLAPPTIDQVLVGSIERSRHPDIAAAILLGFNDGVFPKRPAEDSILNDDDRDLLIERGVMVSPGARRRIMDESLLVYIAATRPSQHLVLTYAAADENGKALRPSPFVHDFRAALPGLTVRSVADPVRAREAWDVRGPADLRRRITEEFRTRPVAVSDDSAARALWNGIYSGSCLHLREDVIARRAFRALDDREPCRLSAHTVSRLFDMPFRTSVSQLESYATCPFQFFARHGLRLRERTEAVLEPVDVGQVHHAVLEHFAGELRRDGRGIGELSEADIHTWLQSSCRSAQGGFAPDGFFDARNAYILRRCGERLARVLHAQRRRCAGRVIRTAGVELPFGFDLPNGLPALSITTPKSRQVVLRGYIDRLDIVEHMDELLGIVIDYKTTRDRRLDFSAVYHGLSLQLPAYLLAIAESGHTAAGRPIRPAGALYTSLASRYQLVDHPDRTSPRDDLLGGTYRPRGLLLADALPALDSAENGWSPHYSAFRKKDGTYAALAGSDVAAAEEFAAVLGHVRRKLGELADGVLDGEMPVSPCRNAGLTPCSWCGLSVACRVEVGSSEARYAERLKRPEVLQRLNVAAGPISAGPH